ncbi:hypothetical protein As57867_007142, partial [Aphanomyces stellatus]
MGCRSGRQPEHVTKHDRGATVLILADFDGRVEPSPAAAPTPVIKQRRCDVPRRPSSAKKSNQTESFWSSSQHISTRPQRKKRKKSTTTQRQATTNQSTDVAATPGTAEPSALAAKALMPERLAS